MRTKIMRNTALMVGVVLALLGASSLPASATVTPLHLDFTGTGSVTINGTVVTTIPNTSAPGPCDAGGHSYLTPDLDDSTSPDTIDLDVADYHLAAGTWSFLGSDLRVQVNGHHDTAGTIDGSGNVSLPIDVQIVVSECDGSPVLCTVNHVTATLTNPANGYTGSVPPVDEDTFSDLQGTSAPITSFGVGCNAVLRSFLFNQQANIDVNLTYEDDTFPHAD